MLPGLEITPGRRWGLTALACAALGVYAMVALTPIAVSTALPVSHAHLGSLMFAHFFGFLITSIIVGFLSDRYGRKGFMLIGCVALAVGSVGMLWCEQFWVGMAAMLISGLGGGALGPPALALTGLVHPERRSGMISLVESWFCFGAAGWVLGATAVLGSAGGWRLPGAVTALVEGGSLWRLPFLLAALAPLGLAAAMLAVRFPAFHDTDRRDTGRHLTLLREPMFLVTAAAIFLYAATEAGTQAWIPRYLKERFAGEGASTLTTPAWIPTYLTEHFTGEGVFAVATPLALFWGAMGFWRLVWPVVMRRVSDRQVLIGSMVAAVLLHGAAILVDHQWAILLLFGGLGLAFGAVWPLLVAGVIRRFPDMAGTATGTIVAASGIGVTLGPFLLGHIAEGATVRAAMQSVWFVTLATLIASSLIPRPKARNTAPPPSV